MLVTRVDRSSRGSFAHSSWTCMNSWSRDDGLSARFASASLSAFQRFSSGLRSGDWLARVGQCSCYLQGIPCFSWRCASGHCHVGRSRPGIVQFLHLGSHLMAEYAVVGLTVHNSLNPLQDPHARRVETAPHHYFATPMLDSWCEAVIFEFLKRTSSKVSVHTAWK